MGRKGIKDHSDVVIASNANYALQYARCSTILIQNPFLPYSRVHYCVAMDRTKSSEKALVDALLLSEPDDRITVLHIRMKDEERRDIRNNPDAEPNVIMDFEKRIQELIHSWSTMLSRPRNITLTMLDESEKPPSHDIIEWVFSESNNVHVVCVGADQERVRKNKHYLGSCSTTVVLNCVREGIPVVVAHYDERFFVEGAVEALPDSAARPGTAELPVQRMTFKK